MGFFRQEYWSRLLCPAPGNPMANRRGKGGSSNRFPFLGLQNLCGQWNQKAIYSWQKNVMTNLDSMLKKQRHYYANKSLYSQGYGLPGGHLWLWELDSKEGRMPKNWYFWTVVLKTPESPLDSKEIKPVSLKGDLPWIFTERTDAEALVFWSSSANRPLIGSPWY